MTSASRGTVRTEPSATLLTRLAGALSLLALARCAPATDAAHAPIIDGTPSDEAAVVALLERQPTCPAPAEPLVVCTATLVAPRAVITAAHCLEGRSASSLAVASSLDAASVPVRLAHVHPAYDPTTHAHDLAVLHLAGELAATPVALRRAPLDGAAGALVRVVGFGATDVSGASSDGRREGVSRVDAVSALALELAPAPASTCRGDSGGPTLGVDDDGGETLWAVTSFGDVACATVGVAARVDVDLDFVDDALARAPDPAGDAPFDGLCARGCASALDCPPGFECEGGGCTFAGIPRGEYGAGCDASDDLCACVETALGCRCYEPCAEAPVAEPAGCAVRPARSSRSAWPLTAALLATWIARRRASPRRAPRPRAPRTPRP